MPQADARDKVAAAISKLRKRDRIGVGAEVLSAAGGAAAGAAAAGSVAAAAGATTFLGSTTLASIVGGVLVTATPVGWVVGSAVVVGAAGYGLARLARSGSREDAKRKEIADRLDARGGRDDDSPAESLEEEVLRAVEWGRLSPAHAQRLRAQVERGAISPSAAVQMVREICAEP